MSERVNIKNMSVQPEVPAERTFDPVEDISPSDWKAMESLIVRYADISTSDKASDYVSLSACLLLMGRRYEPYQDFIERFREQFENDGNQFDDFLEGSSLDLRMLGYVPEKAEKWARRLEKMSTKRYYLSAINYFGLTGRILPTTKSSPDVLLRHERDKWNRTVITDEAIEEQALEAAHLTLLGYRPRITQGHWAAWRRGLDTFRSQGAWFLFMFAAGSMSLLSASSYTFTPTGIQVKHDKRKPDEPLSPPLTSRNF